jgi:hypothetical protein
MLPTYAIANPAQDTNQKSVYSQILQDHGFALKPGVEDEDFFIP